MSPEGTPFSARGLPPEVEAGGESLYEVTGPIENANAGIAAYWQGGGFGIQYELPNSIEELIAQGLLKRYTP